MEKPKVTFYVQAYDAKKDGIPSVKFRLLVDINGKSKHLAVLGSQFFNPVLDDYTRMSLMEFSTSSNLAIHQAKKKFREIDFDDEKICEVIREKVIEKRKMF